MSTTIGGDSAYAVAFRLFMTIEAHESSDTKPELLSDYRGYALDLFRECLTTVDATPEK